MPRYCHICRCLSDVGFHGPDGRFYYPSVPVTDKEIDDAQMKSGASKYSRERTRRNIALGKHIGVYHPNGWYDVASGGFAPLPDEGFIRLRTAVLGVA